MRFLIINTDYPEFLEWLYGRHAGLALEPYEQQLGARNESLFGVADFYSSNLRKLGHEAWDIHANNEFMQRAWAQEHAIAFDPAPVAFSWAGRTLYLARRAAAASLRRHLTRLGSRAVRRIAGTPRWFHGILAAQIKHYKPDVVLNQAMSAVSGAFLAEMRSYVRLVAGQIASPLPANAAIGAYDIIFSSLPNFVQYFRSAGVRSELNRLGFEPSILPRLEEATEDVPVSFVGSLTPRHMDRVRLLERLCSTVELSVWGTGVNRLPRTSGIRSRFVGAAWGIEMYRVLRRSRIALNHHIGLAGQFANNMRLFEATGVGTLLITDSKENLHEMFEPGREVLTYGSADECIELIRHFVDSPQRRAIAEAGQRRTLREHTYFQRMQELVDWVGHYLQ